MVSVDDGETDPLEVSCSTCLGSIIGLPSTSALVDWLDMHSKSLLHMELTDPLEVSCRTCVGSIYGLPKSSEPFW
jgi:hypothetical protein